MIQSEILIFALVLGIVPAFCAEDKLPDVCADLQNADAAAAEADALAKQVRDAMAAGGGDYVALLDKQAALSEKAEQAYREVLVKAPDHPVALANFGLFWIKRKQPGQARNLLGAALRSYRVQQKKAETAKTPLPPEFVLAPAREAFLRRTLGGLLERSGDNGDALQNYREAFKLDNTDPRNRLSLAIALCAAGQPQDAATLLKPWAEETAQANVSDKPEKDPGTLALGLYTLALANEETGFLEDALQIYRRAQKLAEQAGAGDVSGVFERSGMAVARLEDTFDIAEVHAKERAAENEERAKKKLPPLPDERENYAKAARMCDQGLTYKDEALDDAEFRRLLMQLRLSSSSDREDAVSASAANDALAKNPRFEVFLSAMRSFQEAIVKFPRMSRPYFELASCSVMLGRYSTAKKLLDEGSMYSPNSLALLNLHGEVLLQLGQWEEAQRVFTRILALENESGRANFGLARACAALKSDARLCQSGLNALDRAEQLGVREIRPPVANGQQRPPSLREELTSALQRFERGEKPPPRPVLKGSANAGHGRAEPAMPDLWKGTIIGR